MAEPSAPSPPASLTAAASWGVAALAMGAWRTGCSIPSSSVTAVARPMRVTLPECRRAERALVPGHAPWAAELDANVLEGPDPLESEGAVERGARGIRLRDPGHGKPQIRRVEAVEEH